VPEDRARYVAAVLDAYRRTPGTLRHVRPPDRRLAEELHDAGVPLATVEAALALAAARRSCRPDDAPPLPPIRCFHYFKPVIDELIGSPAAPSYLAYVRDFLARCSESRPHPDT
jgi:hypothetical protein